LIYAKAQELLNQCQLEQAAQLAAENNFIEAIAAAAQSETQSFYSKAQELSKQWSNRVITLATAQFQAGNSIKRSLKFKQSLQLVPHINKRRLLSGERIGK